MELENILDESNQKLIKIFLAFIIWYVLFQIVIEVIEQTFTAITLLLLNYDTIFGLTDNQLELFVQISQLLATVLIVSFVCYYLFKLVKIFHKELSI